MKCTQVKIVGGRFIECTSIYPIEYLPGFFELWIENGKRRIVNGRAIVEIIVEEDRHYNDLPVIVC